MVGFRKFVNKVVRSNVCAWMCMRVCAWMCVCTCTQIRVFVRTRGSIVFFRLPMKFMIIEFHTSHSETQMCSKTHSYPRFCDSQMTILCQRKIWTLILLRVKYILVKSINDWICLLETLEEHERDGAKNIDPELNKSKILEDRSLVWFNLVFAWKEAHLVHNDVLSFTHHRFFYIPVSIDIITFINRFFSP